MLLPRCARPGVEGRKVGARVHRVGAAPRVTSVDCTAEGNSLRPLLAVSHNDRIEWVRSCSGAETPSTPSPWSQAELGAASLSRLGEGPCLHAAPCQPPSAPHPLGALAPGRDFPHCVGRNRSTRTGPAAAAVSSRWAASPCPSPLPARRRDVQGTLRGWPWEEEEGFS